MSTPHGPSHEALLVDLPRALRGDLARVVDHAMDTFRRERRRRSRGVARVVCAIDDLLRTDALEHVDDPTYPAEKRSAIMRDLDRVNVALFTYPRLVRAITPTISRVHAIERRPVRILEVASGTGDMATALAEHAAARRIAIELVGSDVSSDYVAMAERRARARGSKVRFETIDAFSLERLPAHAFDVVLMAQSLHHFRPGQLARVIAGARHAARHAFVGIDVRRSFAAYPVGLVAAAAVSAPGFLHDTVLTLRKVYSEDELRLVGELSAPGCAVTARPLHPGFSLLEIDLSSTARDPSQKGAHPLT
ncbi:MAG: methyltransferase domain-containing protein [Polyangiaceae bacterium]